MKSFLTKVKRYSASNVPEMLKAESVLASYHTKEEAQAHADRWNHNYQTDTAFVEPFDPEKMVWPDRHGWNGILDD